MRRSRHATLTRTITRNGTRTLAFLLCVAFSETAYPVASVIPIAPEPVGSGARALGQSAFIAVADDATAASWNPAGLINLERPEASFVGAWKTVTSDPSLSTADFSMDPASWDVSEINFMSYAQPVRAGNVNAVLSVNYHQVYDLGAGFNYSVEYEAPQGGTDIQGAKGRSEGAISAYSFAAALSLPSCPQVAFGASFNWYDQGLLRDNAWRIDQRHSLNRQPTSISTETYDDFGGYNFTLGVLWDVFERGENLLTLGFVCHTPFTAKVDQEVVSFTPDGKTKLSTDPGRIDIDFPFSLGAGVNYRLSDSLSTAFDVQWTNWSKFRYTDAQSTPRDDAVAVRWGFERLWFSQPAKKSVYALRGGVFYEPRPAWGDLLSVYGFSVGLGWTMKDRFSLDFAYQFRWGQQEDAAGPGLISDVDYDLQEHLLIGSFIVYL